MLRHDICLFVHHLPQAPHCVVMDSFLGGKRRIDVTWCYLGAKSNNVRPAVPNGPESDPRGFQGRTTSPPGL